MTTSYITHADCLRHEMGSAHPECPERLLAVNEHMRASGLLDRLRILDAPLASQEDLKRVHRCEYVNLIFERAPSEGYVQLDQYTAMNPHTLAAARRAAGAGVLAVDELMAGRSENAFCAIRPCGHHATPSHSGGFCLFNNIAVAAAYAIEKQGLQRVAIVDFDVHHGNGTEDMFSTPRWQKQVLMVSFFAHPFYPLSGIEDLAPNMVNIPLVAGSDGRAARKAFEERWRPALESFKPQMLFISAGFDAHREDGLGALALVEEDYEWMTRELMGIARQTAENRIVSMLEGGYTPAALARSVVVHVRALAAASA